MTFADHLPFGPFSKRELELLRLLAQRLTNHEIAERLTIAYTTVKWYNRQIFNKLNVNNRREAIKVAQALNLLNGDDTVLPSRHSLNIPITPFIGRQNEIEDLTRLIETDAVRLITILALGGMGKTRLALAVVSRPVSKKVVYFASLVAINEPENIITAIAEAVGLQFVADKRQPKQQLLEFLSKKHGLLLLDNFEHLVDYASIVTEILEVAPNLKIIVTSREKLNLSFETVYTLTGMDYPHQLDAEDVFEYNSIQLFIQCARRTRSDFAAQPLNDIVRICQLVQGMPLAIELAAAWVGTISLAEIYTEIALNIDFLQSAKRDIPERLHSLQAVFESSWKRLNPDEQVCFSKLSVFHGGFSREAAQAITHASLYTLTSLVNKALVWHDQLHGRYELHELLRQYAEKKLDAVDEVKTTLAAYTEYFAAKTGAWGKGLTNGDQLASLDVIEADFDNIRKAFKYAVEQDDIRLIEPFTEIWLFYEIRGLWLEGQAAYNAAIEKLRPQDSVTLGRLLARRALFLYRLGLMNESLECSQTSLATLQRCGAIRETIFSLLTMGDAICFIDGLDKGHNIYTKARQLSQEYDDQWGLMVTTALLGVYKWSKQDFGEAKSLFERSYEIAKNRGDLWLMGFVLMFLGDMCLETQDYETAKRAYQEALMSAKKIHQPLIISGVLAGLGALARTEGNLNEARYLFEDFLRIQIDTGRILHSINGLAQLGETACDMEDYQQARQDLYQALEIAHDRGLTDQIFNVIYVFLVYDIFLIKVGHFEPAAELFGFIESHFDRDELSARILEKFQQCIMHLRTEMPKHDYEAAVKRGQSLELADVVEKLLVDLRSPPINL